MLLTCIVGFNIGLVVVGINAGSLPVGGTDVGESLGLGVVALLICSSVVGLDVGFNEGFRDVGLEVGDVLADKSAIGVSVTRFKAGPSIGIPGFNEGCRDVGLEVEDVLADKSANGDSFTGFNVGPSLCIPVVGVVFGFNVGLFVVGINVGSLLVGGTDVGESLGFGVGASLLGSSVVGL